MDLEQATCQYCLKSISGTYIKCMDCSVVSLCLTCFCLGAEAGSHKKTHDYQIKTTSKSPAVPVFEDWNALEELQLLEALEQYGVGNWEDVAFKVETKTPQECMQHYSNYYLSGPCYLALTSDRPVSRVTDHTCHSSQHSPVYPHSPMIHVEVEDQQLLGYMPARGDFERDYDNDAESILCRLHPSFSHDDLEDALKVAQVGIYMQRLRERQRRKEIAREHGLIAQILAFILNKRFKKRVLPLKETTPARKRGRPPSPRRTIRTGLSSTKKAITKTSSGDTNNSLFELRCASPPPGSWLAAPFVLKSSGATRGTPLVASGHSFELPPLPLSHPPLPLSHPPLPKSQPVFSNVPSSHTGIPNSCENRIVFLLNDKLKPFLRYFTNAEGKQFMDNLYREELLKHEIKYLLDCRAKGKIKLNGTKSKIPPLKSSVYNAPQKCPTGPSGRLRLGCSASSSHCLNVSHRPRKKRRHFNTPWYVKVQRRAKRFR
ncbi:Transcriptional adaptor 2 (Ada2) [Fasciolopsis buskii]|uniref:Transcriptional adaptor 2 (Ada2) n=1 Tax=Fasciolopsis buskii TaxID=27845 RepID=A0A8E0RYD9_9TREM|nr:Transcriptional adaptor 2 (Ada2) [Fasciolopsis buski]